MGSFFVYINDLFVFLATMGNNLTIRLLGTGTSQGVPVIGCQCHVCKSAKKEDKRLRSALLFTWNNENFVIDSGPDFRQQMLREDIRSLRAVIYTHEHKDHIAGMDDVRAFNFLEKRNMEVYCSAQVGEALKREFYYAFGDNLYPGVPRININVIENKPFELPNGPLLIPVLGYHYKLPVFGFRIGNFAYLTDVKTLPKEEKKKLENLEVLILDCLQEEPHISHLNLEEALALIEELQPKTTYLTHISHRFGTQAEIQLKLPPHVHPAYDGLKIECEVKKEIL